MYTNKCRLYIVLIVVIAITHYAICEPDPQQLMPQQPQVHQHPTMPPQLVSQTVPVQEGRRCLHTSECDGPNTVLGCERGRCSCPMRPQMQWTRGKYPLNTVWDVNHQKCLSVKDSACDIFNPKSVYCSQGLVCRSESDKNGFGLCVNSSARFTSFELISFLSIGALIFQYYNFK